jgi:hypothetical protein
MLLISKADLLTSNQRYITNISYITLHYQYFLHVYITNVNTIGAKPSALCNPIFGFGFYFADSKVAFCTVVVELSACMIVLFILPVVIVDKK